MARKAVSIVAIVGGACFVVLGALFSIREYQLEVWCSGTNLSCPAYGQFIYLGLFGVIIGAFLILVGSHGLSKESSSLYPPSVEFEHHQNRSAVLISRTLHPLYGGIGKVFKPKPWENLAQ